MLQANNKQVPQKSYSLKTRIDSVNQILKKKEKVTQTRNKYIDQNYRLEESKSVKSLYNTPHAFKIGQMLQF